MLKTISEVSLARDLVKCQSVTPKDDGAINVVAKNLKKLGFKCQIMEFQEKGTAKIKNLYAKIGKESPNLCFAGHTDVVPVGDLKSWTVNPFGGVIKNQKLIGRGVSDMKGSISCFVAAVSEFLKRNKKLKGSISFLITGDEETVAINGTQKVVEKLIQKKEKIDFCIVGEPTNENRLGEMIKIGRRGSMTGHLTILGTQGHVAYPHTSNNPSTIIVDVLNKIKNLKLDRGNKDFEPSNLEVTKITIDNTADNIIPAEAKASFNIRFNNLHTSSSLKKKLNRIFSSITQKSKANYKIKYHVSGESFLTKPNKTVYMIKSVIKKSTKISPVLSTTGGTSDARFIKKIAPCIEFGLIAKTIHQVDEMARISDLKKLKNIYLDILVNYFK
ncbi:MAG: succinyl-diaminopimelate desuccinylase [Proteobacteria bacterium]|jgi:succinyl-diaminopimelate desuccinylase|nr:succinyl-diaminopimelate desuccinylase [Alphaproteobacteria bacterium]NBU53924.1 succinyl-diaminopimelate desuccinylase [Candidatus Fonsibacter sp. PEL3]NBV93063.1 succinyl-diaminopimelate desuccinylase [Candidatus Fonsibacter sp. PEL4]